MNLFWKLLPKTQFGRKFQTHLARGALKNEERSLARDIPSKTKGVLEITRLLSRGRTVEKQISFKLVRWQVSKVVSLRHNSVEYMFEELVEKQMGPILSGNLPNTLS